MGTRSLFWFYISFTTIYPHHLSCISLLSLSPGREKTSATPPVRSATTSRFAPTSFLPETWLPDMPPAESGRLEAPAV
ncbi:hypothetical protein K461DRAFT_280989 [Myriangium duriaei CBS 260.36]|uniref:Uncharacterized protein n=1 Tax=Myriangium duriaei CBS 260.36 TaxID=1168546 RepID=A0A9P4MJG3_9PEZI|nr:hypothetical protein K461DRAFT_280989 [Myriangium duriaei CBS 260.36]